MQNSELSFCEQKRNKVPDGNALKYFALLVREMYSLYSYAKSFLWKHGFTPLTLRSHGKNIILIRLSEAKRNEAVSNVLDFSRAVGASSVPLGTFTAHAVSS